MKFSLEALQRLQLLQAQYEAAPGKDTGEPFRGELCRMSTDILADLVTLHEIGAKVWDGHERRVSSLARIKMASAMFVDMVEAERAKAQNVIGSAPTPIHDPRDPEVEEASRRIPDE